MKMYVPEIGDRFVLTEDWYFSLHHERRNETLLDRIYGKPDHNDRNIDNRPWNMHYSPSHNTGPTYVVLPAGTVLSVDRIYVRKGSSDFSSLTFNIVETTHPALSKKGRKRFWAKLADCNRIEFERAE